MTGLVLALALSFVPHCGSTSYLEYKPVRWSSTCTAGEQRVTSIRWDKWGAKSASGEGIVRVSMGDGRRPFPASTSIELSRPRTCRRAGGGSYRYFSRVTVAVSMGTDPIHRPHARTSVHRIPPAKGACTRD